MKDEAINRLTEIMRIAKTLSWFFANPKGYPLMQASEVEKCILMALDNAEFEIYREAAKNPFKVALNAHENAAGGQITEETKARFDLWKRTYRSYRDACTQREASPVVAGENQKP